MPTILLIILILVALAIVYKLIVEDQDVYLGLALWLVFLSSLFLLA